MTVNISKEVLHSFLDKGFLLSPDILEEEGFDTDFLNLVDTRILSKEKPVVIGSDIYKGVSKKGVTGINWVEFEKSRVLHEKGKTNRVYSSFLELIFDEPKDNSEESTGYTIIKKEEAPEPKLETIEEVAKEIQSQPVVEEVVEKVVPEIQTPQEQTNLSDSDYPLKVVTSYGDESKLREVKDFVGHYKSRYEFLRKIVASRQEMQNVISINRTSSKERNEKVALIGLVYDKRITKKGNTMITLEDTTGTIRVVFDPNKAKGIDYLCPDELIGVVGKVNENFMYASEIIFPDIPEKLSVKKYNEDICAAFISDVHVGSSWFIEDKFLELIDWLNGKHKDPNMIELSKKIKYLFITGDMVDGVGIYPNQDKELTIKSIRGQYDRCAELIKMIRNDIKIILCPGNHDARRIAEPQPPLDIYAESLKQIKNLTLVSNPAMINVLGTEGFEGFDILMYHGYSYDYYAANIGPIMMDGGYDRGDSIMKFLLKKRHLSPVHTSTLFVPNGKEDYLLIDHVPDIFVSGHIHKSSVSKYKGVTNIMGSCWQYKTDFQEKVGHHPEYCKVPIFNFGSGETMIVDFAPENKVPEIKNGNE
ncbi:hypothetical protein HOM13_03405 [Candidatus Woesearchaeota archaeon]|jgi:DNA polymerase II small subunit|nr:hypothetical protein [Candidatus Woesearchaeota archaeon]MBT5215756.1 hypothetical protein [Candidatus Woesearchaeota archaeon]MBT6402174.1 hypothetical protein [Candidatus Woesearchaeota archaeon]